MLSVVVKYFVCDNLFFKVGYNKVIKCFDFNCIGGVWMFDYDEDEDEYCVMVFNFGLKLECFECFFVMFEMYFKYQGVVSIYVFQLNIDNVIEEIVSGFNFGVMVFLDISVCSYWNFFEKCCFCGIELSYL